MCRFSCSAGAAILLIVVSLAGCSAGTGQIARPVAAVPTATTPQSLPGTTDGSPGCTTAVAPAPQLPVRGVTRTAHAEGTPLAVITPPAGDWAFASLASAVDVFRLAGTKPPELASRFTAPSPATDGSPVPPGTPATLGSAVTPDGRWLLLADAGWGADVVSVAAAERGSRDPVIGQLSAGTGLAGATEVTVSRDGRYVFVSLEYARKVEVYDLPAAIAGHFGKAGWVGAIPAGPDPVGLAVSPDGRWLYSVSEGGHAAGGGTLSVISVAKAETDPAASVMATVAAGCNPVRVITSASGAVVWVTARESDAVLAFSAARLLTDPAYALLADVRVGEAPVGMALVRGGALLVAGDSSRFSGAGTASLAIVSVTKALAGQPALLGYLATGTFPRDMTLTPDGQLLIASYLAGQVAQVNTAGFP
jgi:DNA-binding beta-propeller fold protein YncE